MKIANDYLTNAYLQKSEISNHQQENKNFSEILENVQEENKKVPPHAVSAKEVELLGGAMFVNAVRETMSIQGINEPFKINSAILSEVRSKRHSQSDPIKLKAMLEKDLEVLQSPTDIQKGYLNGKPESEAHFRARKNEAIDYAKELIKNLKV